MLVPRQQAAQKHLLVNCPSNLLARPSNLLQHPANSPSPFKFARAPSHPTSSFTFALLSSWPLLLLPTLPSCRRCLQAATSTQNTRLTSCQHRSQLPAGCHNPLRHTAQCTSLHLSTCKTDTALLTNSRQLYCQSLWTAGSTWGAKADSTSAHCQTWGWCPCRAAAVSATKLLSGSLIGLNQAFQPATSKSLL